MTWHVDTFFKIKKLKKQKQKQPNWPKFDENEDLIERKTKMKTKWNKNNKNRNQMYI